MSEQKNTDMSQHFHRVSAADFMKIPGNPIAYWAGVKIRNIFLDNPPLKEVLAPKQGTSTGNDEIYVRQWYEVDFELIGFNFKNLENALDSEKVYFPLNKGGEFRRWYGNNEKVIKFGSNAFNQLINMGNQLPSRSLYFRKGVTWSKITSNKISVRYDNIGFVFSSVGLKGFPDESEINNCLAYMNSTLVEKLTKIISPTLSIISGDIEKLPYIKNIEIKNTSKLIGKFKSDWDSYEVSWDFASLSLLAHGIKQPTASFTYKKIREQWQSDTQEMQRLEEENNRIFIDAYGLQDELTPEVPLKEITLTCNPNYRYGGDLTDQEREDRLQSDTIAELLSYAIGCMMGRYSLNREGLVYAHAGNQGFADLVVEGAYKTFSADDDGILPLTEQEWFSDDVTNRLSEFVSTVWGEQQLEENLQFIADSLCLYALKAKKGERALDTIRRYLSNQFYKDHLRTYKRRPIYWLFSSGKHKAFECLVYLHRYHEGTLARMRTEYVIPLTARINARINRLQEEAEAASSTSERKQLMAELKTLQNQQAELATFDEQLRHHADQRISIDLDDGVKENYGKFGNLLAAVKDVTGKAAD